MKLKYSKIEQLLAELCPAGVEFRELGEVCDLKNGYTPSKIKQEFWTNGSIPWFRMEDIRKNGRILNNSLQHITMEAVKGRKTFQENSIIISTTATIGEHALITVPFVMNQQLTALTLKDNFKKILNIKFTFYYCYKICEECKKKVNPGFSLLGISKMKLFKFPIPPLSIQEEIVKILDTFTKLEAELEARKKQYEYYRDKLLTFGDEVEFKKISDVLSRSKGTKITASRMKELNKSEGKIKIFAGGKTYAMVNPEDIPKKDIHKIPSIIVKSRGVIEFEYYDKAFSHKNEFWSYYTQNQDINIKFIFYYLRKKEPYFQNIASKMQMPQISLPDTEKFKVPLPPLPIQEKIVAILDKFDALVNDISSGLPAEIEARKKQYEHYREKLLTFTPLKTEPPAKAKQER